METIKVNMTPCEDIKTIHASQNDNEARQWGFELHNNGEKIDSSSISDQLVFKAYEGGTEQILPENTSTPTTSPFLGDIKYPQGLLSDQEFLYRESPTEEDGLAKITDIKGNTIVWNQLVKNGNFADTSNWATGNATLSVSSNKATLTVTNNGTVPFYQTINQKTAEHKILVLFNAYASRSLNLTVNWGFQIGPTITLTTSNQRFSVLATVRTFGNNNFNLSAVAQTGDVINYSNVQLFDLTQMGLDSITADEFTSLFPLPYYSYNQGSLLSFNGNGIKTVGFNLFDQDSVLPSVGFVEQSDGSFYIQSPSIANYGVLFENKLKYSGQFFLVYKYKYERTTGQGCRFEVHYTDGTVDQIYAQGSNDFVEISFISRANKVLDYISATYGSNIGTWWKDVCINISDPSKDGTYEPYKEITTDLPISTYFPTGMKSAGNVYDELTESKAITRIGSVDLGTLRWTYSTDSQIFTSGAVLQRALTRNGICAQYDKIDGWSEFNQSNKSIFLPTNSNIVRIKDPGYTDATAFKSAMSGVYLYCELATESETSFTTASLVTENAEIPLSNEDGILIGKCTEQLSSESGFFDAKIKLADEDGECYSNKLQLHVERSPQ